MFNVELSTPEFAGQGVVALRGELDMAHAPGVASHMATAVAVYGPWVVVDMAALEYIGSAGLGVLVRVLKWTRANGGDLPLAAPQGGVRKVLTVTGLIGVFTVYPSVEQAVRGAEEARRLAASRAVAASGEYGPARLGHQPPTAPAAQAARGEPTPSAAAH
jgi:anti-sigma B factor antagonist